MYEDFTVPSRLLLLSFAPIRDHEGVIHSGEAVFLVEPLNVRVSVFVPLGEQAEEISKLEGRYVDMDIEPLGFKAFNAENPGKPLIAREPPDSETGAERYRLVGLFRIFEPEGGIFECGNLRFPLYGQMEARNGRRFFIRDALRIDISEVDWLERLEPDTRPAKSVWVELRRVRFYGYLMEGGEG